MKIAICDDNEAVLRMMKNYIEEFFRKNGGMAYSVESFSSGDKLLSDQKEYDLVFLDIEMPGRDGISVGRMIKERYPKCIIIVITSFSEYLDDAMKFSVFRYLSKPIDKNRLFRNMKDAVEVYSHRSRPISIEMAGQCYKVESDDIIMLEAQNRKVVMYTSNDSYDLAGTLKEWYDKLQLPSFFMCHRSYVVNIARITSISEDKVVLEHGKYQAYLTKRKHAELKNKFMMYIEKNR